MSTLRPVVCMVGSSNIDLIVRAPRIPLPGETISGSAFQRGFGGKGANQAVMAARLGASVRVITKLGRDLFGDDTVRSYAEQGIDTAYVLRDDVQPSGVALITVDDRSGQNSIVIVPGANGSLSPADIQAAEAAIVGADVLICQLEIPLETTLEAFRIAKPDTRTITILNPAPAVPLPDALLSLTDVIIPNEVEAGMLTGMTVRTPDQAADAARALQAKGIATVIITLGDRGALLLDADNEPIHMPADSVQAVDATGAGDAFVGSIATFIGMGVPMREAVRRAGAIATLSVQKSGAQTSFPYRDDVAHLFD